MTLLMSAVTALFDKKLAVLVMQLLGIPTALGVAFLTRQLARMLYENELVPDLAFVGILFSTRHLGTGLCWAWRPGC